MVRQADTVALNPLALKLSRFAPLSTDDLATLDGLAANAKSMEAKHNLITEGERPEVVFLLLSGWACRYKTLANGARQIVAFLLPGDLCDVHIFILKEMDHSISLLSKADVAEIPKSAILNLFDDSPNLARALWWATLVDEGILREWVTNVGQRNAFARIAHLFAELWIRMTTVGLTKQGSFDLPLSQEELGDTVGLTPVHVNRTLQHMRKEGLLTFKQKRLHIPDVHRLMEVSGFMPNYLHLEPRNN